MWVNSVAIAHGSTSALPFTAILTVLRSTFSCRFPLTVFGGFMAKNYASADFNAPTSTTKVAREIPTEVPWYRGRTFQVLIAGFLPFSAIYIEATLHFRFHVGTSDLHSFWDLVSCLCSSGDCHFLHHRCLAVLPAWQEKITTGGGPLTSMVE